MALLEKTGDYTRLIHKENSSVFCAQCYGNASKLDAGAFESVFPFMVAKMRNDKLLYFPRLGQKKKTSVIWIN
jgi:hypothetical protein